MGTNRFLKLCLVVFTSCYFFNHSSSQSLDHEYLTNNKINKSGTALTYTVSSNESRSLFLKDFKNNMLYKFDNINANHLLNENFFLGKNDKNKTLYIVELNKKIIDSLVGVDDFEWFEKTNTLLTYNRQTKSLKLMNIKTGVREDFSNILNYSTNYKSSNLAFVNKDQTVFIYSTVSNHCTKFDNSNSKSYLKKLLWDKTGKNVFGFFIEDENFKIYKYSNQSSQFVYTHSFFLNNKDMQVDTLFTHTIILNDQQIAVGLNKSNHFVDTSDEPEIWLGSSNGITPYEEKLKFNNQQLAVIDLYKKEIFDYSEPKKLLKFVVSGKKNDIYSYEKSVNYDFSRLNPEIEIYEYNKKGLKIKQLGLFNAPDQNIKSSHKTDLLFFFKDNNWHYYDKKLKQTVNFTVNLNDSFFNQNNEFYKMIDSPINQYLLTYKDKYLLFTGTNFLWLFDLNTYSIKQVEASSKRNYLISQANYSINRTLWDWNINVNQYDFKDILLTWKTEDHTREGVSILTNKEEIIDLLEVNSKIKQIARANKKISYLRESANQPPALYVLDFDSKKETLVFQSNLIDTLVKNVKVVYHSWKNNHNKARGAVVTYPINYDPTLKYPAIFEIYEQRKSTQHTYVPTTITNGNGINSRVYSNEGYFVIRPDIFYEIGEPGPSASQCVNETLDYLMNILPLDADNLGLIGHSFGGYQTNYIITQTNRFKAAVSSAGVADIVNAYFTFSQEYKIPDMFRYETQQFRMGKNFFEAKNNYMQNSPLFYADRIETPLLLITGKKDYTVNWQQSITMYLALKRLNKNVNLVLYPNEGHSFMKRKNILDSSQKIKEWFNYYLKGEKEPQWLNEGL